MTAVWALALPDSQKIVLLALADCANDEGHCWPSMATLAKKCSKGERTVQGVIKDLVAGGHLSRIEKPGKGCDYWIHPVQAKPEMQGYSPPETHYVYRIDDADSGCFYVGARSCVGAPDDDDYMGSGKWVKEARQQGRALRKSIVCMVQSREQLAVTELHEVRRVFGDPLCMNAKLPTLGTLTATGFRAPPPQSLPPAEPAPRKRRTPPPQGLRDTPAAAADKPSENHQEPSDDCASDDAPRLKPEHILEKWNGSLARLGKRAVRDLTPARRQLLKARIGQYPITDFLDVFEKIERSPFLRGDTGWHGCNFDWVFKRANFQKILEGNYDQ